MSGTTFAYLAIACWLGLAAWGAFTTWRDALLAGHQEELERLELKQKSILDLVRDRHLRELKKQTEAVARITEKASKIRFDLDPDGCYAVTVRFDRRLLEQTFGRDDLGMIASDVGRRIEYEIATGKFIESAHDTVLNRELASLERGKLFAAQMEANRPA